MYSTSLTSSATQTKLQELAFSSQAFDGKAFELCVVELCSLSTPKDVLRLAAKTCVDLIGLEVPSRMQPARPSAVQKALHSASRHGVFSNDDVVKATNAALLSDSRFLTDGHSLYAAFKAAFPKELRFAALHLAMEQVLIRLINCIRQFDRVLFSRYQRKVQRRVAVDTLRPHLC